MALVKIRLYWIRSEFISHETTALFWLNSFICMHINKCMDWPVLGLN